MTLTQLEQRYPQEYHLYINWLFENYNLWNIPGKSREEQIEFLKTLPPDFFCWSLMTYLNPDSKVNADREFDKYLSEQFNA